MRSAWESAAGNRGDRGGLAIFERKVAAEDVREKISALIFSAVFYVATGWP